MARFLRSEGVLLHDALNPCAVKRSESYVVWGTNSRRVIETQPTAERAAHACEVLNAHAEKNGGEFVTWDFCEEI